MSVWNFIAEAFKYCVLGMAGILVTCGLASIIISILERIADFFRWIKNLIEMRTINNSVERERNRNKYAFLKCRSDISKLPCHKELDGDWVYLGDVLNLIDHYMEEQE